MSRMVQERVLEYSQRSRESKRVQEGQEGSRRVLKVPGRVGLGGSGRVWE